MVPTINPQTAEQSTAKESTTLAWKFLDRLHNGMVASRHGTVRWIPGEWQSIGDSQPVICERGFHASPHATQARGYVYGDVLAQVECAGTRVISDDDDDTDESDPPNKACWQRMRVVKMWAFTERDHAALRAKHAEHEGREGTSYNEDRTATDAWLLDYLKDRPTLDGRSFPGYSEED